MAKSYEELAAEITVAWIKAVGEGTAAGTLSDSMLEAKSIQDVYQTAFNAISNAYKNTK